MDGHGQAHRTLRKRIHIHHDPYPHPEKRKRVIDDLSYFFGIITPLFTIPQLYQMWQAKSAAGVSLVSWSAFLIASIFWIVYGVTHKELPIIISQSLWFVLQLLIVISIIVL